MLGRARPGQGEEFPWSVMCVPVWKEVTVPACVSPSSLGTAVTAYTLTDGVGQGTGVTAKRVTMDTRSSGRKLPDGSR